MRLSESIRYWNVTPTERAASYPCEAHAPKPFTTYLRGIDVMASSDHVFRWLCQLKVAPYSYDWIDNRGRPSPTILTPGAERLEVGQSIIVADIVDFEPGRSITAVGNRVADRLFGKITMTYATTPTGRDSARLVVCLTATAESLPARVRRSILGAGDLVMMRKQLRTLKANAEATQRSSSER